MSNVSRQARPAIFIVGPDYHLGDLLWLTTVLASYRIQLKPSEIVVSLPDREISHILVGNPTIDRLIFRNPQAQPVTEWSNAEVHDLRPLAMARIMIREWRRRWPWLYYRDLWLEPRGQWLATYLGLGTLAMFRPVLALNEADRVSAPRFTSPYVVLAPHSGSYSLPLVGRVWRKIKEWDQERWVELVRKLADAGIQSVTLGAANQGHIRGSIPVLELPIRHAAVVIEKAEALITGESGLWFVAAALETPFIIVPWWLPRGIDWPAPMGVPYRLIRRHSDSVEDVLLAEQALTAEVRHADPIRPNNRTPTSIGAPQ